MRRNLFSGLALALVLSPLVAEGQGVAARLDGRLDARTRAAVGALIDSARAAGLPAEPLVDKALEGASKRADGTRIVAAVRRLAGELGAARVALGERASEGELVAGASALHGGVDADALSQLRRERPGQSLTVPLAVLSELIARGVNADTATTTVLALTEGRASDQQFVSFSREVERDIGVGAPPSVAAMGRASAFTELRTALPGNGDGAQSQAPGGTRQRRKP